MGAKPRRGKGFDAAMIGRSGPRAAALLAAVSAAAAATAALAQDTNTVGPPALKDFQLPGQRTTPPAPTSTPPPPPPPPPSAPPPATTRQPTIRPAPTTPVPSAESDRPAPAPPAVTAPVGGSAPAGTVAAPEPSPLPALEGLPDAPLAEPAPSPAGVTDIPSERLGPRWTILAAAAALAALLAGLALLRLRRRRERLRVEETRQDAREELAAALRPGPPPAADSGSRAPDPPPAVPEGKRAWLELDIVPDRALATEADAAVHYELVLRNRGGLPAGNIRIDSRLFNAGAEAEVAAFLQGPIHEVSGSPQVAIPPGDALRLKGEVRMKMEDVVAIAVEGRRIFVPMVAINIAYDWPGGAGGRTSRSWLVGREAAQPAAKMGAFRLDLGPRVYRQVGRREGRLVQA